MTCCYCCSLSCHHLSSKIQKVYLVGRRGSAQAAFTMKEIRELTKLDGVACVVDPSELAHSLTESSQQEISEQRAKKRMHELLSASLCRLLPLTASHTHSHSLTQLCWPLSVSLL